MKNIGDVDDTYLILRKSMKRNRSDALNLDALAIGSMYIVRMSRCGVVCEERAIIADVTCCA